MEKPKRTAYHIRIGGDKMSEKEERKQLYREIEDYLDNTDIITARAVLDFIKDIV